MINENTKLQDPENEPVSQLLGSLKRVKAPADFDFRVKARIAQGRPAKSTTSWLPASVRYAVPVILMVAVGGYFGFSSFYMADQADVAVVSSFAPAEPAPAAAPPPSTAAVVLPSDEVASERVEVKTPDAVKKITVNQMVKTAPRRNPRVERPGGGSYDVSVKPAINLTPVNANLPLSVTPDEKIEMSAKDFLNSVGVNATFAGSGGRIQSVGSAAAKAGVIAGDVIESINVERATMTVRRDGKSIQITLK